MSFEHTETVNGELKLSYPEGFNLMTSNELKEMFTKESPNRWCIWDKERHAVLDIEWARYNKLILKLTDEKNIARRNEQLMRKGYGNHNYQLEGFWSGQVGNIRGEGYSFYYQVGDAKQRCSNILFRKGNLIYRISLIGVRDHEDADQELFEKILAAVEF